eukprot:6457929-Pyramimonas_sp.AAC.1
MSGFFSVDAKGYIVDAKGCSVDANGAKVWMLRAISASSITGPGYGVPNPGRQGMLNMFIIILRDLV